MKRDALRERALQDDADEAEACAHESLSERLALTIELSDLSRALAEAVSAAWPSAPTDDLEDKSRLYAAPLRALVRA